MSGKWAVVSAAALAGAVLIAGASVLLGGCETLIECTSGGVPMRCHWAYLATGFTGVLAVVSAGLGLLAKGKEARRVSAAMTLSIAAASALLLTDFGIGVCPGGMQCQESIWFVWAGCAVSAVAAIAQFALADPAAEQLPKMSL